MINGETHFITHFTQQITIIKSPNVKVPMPCRKEST